MKKAIIQFTGIVLLLSTLGAKSYSGTEEKVSKAVLKFAKSADQQDAASLDNILHKDFRAVVNRVFGSEEVSIMDKALYLDLIRQNKIGGDKRVVEITKIDLILHNACVKAVFKGEKLIFTTYIQLVEDKNGDWYIINDMPHIEAVKTAE